MKMLIGGKVGICVFHHVLYVPDLTTNLFSVKAVTQKGFKVLFEGEACQIKNNQGDLLGQGSVEGKLFKLNCEPCEIHAAAIAENNVSEVDVWHQRLGHVNDHTLKKIVQEELMTGLKFPKSQTVSFCEGCVKGEATRLPIKPVGEIRSTKMLELVHSDVCGPLQVESFSGKRYLVTFIDDYSRCCAVFFMRYLRSSKSSKLVLLEAVRRIGTLRTDNGGEYISAAFQDYLKSRQIRHQTTVPHMPEQNGVAERMNRTQLEKARSMIAHAGLPKQIWAEAIATAAYLGNRTPTKALTNGTTPYEKWFEREPDASKLKAFGCIAYACIPEIQRAKLDDRAVKLRFVGYGLETKGYRLLDEETKRIYIRRDVTFNEVDFGHDKIPIENVSNHVEKFGYEETSDIDCGSSGTKA